MVTSARQARGAAEKAAATPRNNRGVLLTLSLATAVSALGTSIANVALPSVATEFAMSMSAVQWATLAYLLSTTVSVVLVGNVSDRYGRSTVLGLGIALFVAAALASAFAPNFATLVIARAVQGVGAAAMAALPMATIRQVVSPERVGRAMGLLGSSMAAGMALGPAAGGFIVSFFGWRGVFLVLALLGGLVFVLARAFVRLEPVVPRQHTRFDYFGALLLVSALSVFSIAITMRPGGWLGALTLVAFAVLLLVLFVVVELRRTHPLVNIRMLREARVLPSFAVAFLAAYIMMTFTVVPPFYLTRDLGLSDAWMGVALAVGPLAAIAAGVPAGRIVDRTDARVVTVFGLALMTVSAVSFVLLPAAFGLVGFLVSALLLTPGNQLFMAGNNTATMMRAKEGQQGVVSGLLNLTRNLGFVTGTGTAALLFDSASVVNSVGEIEISGLQMSFAAAAIVGLTAVALALSTVRAARIETPSR